MLAYRQNHPQSCQRSVAATCQSGFNENHTSLSITKTRASRLALDFVCLFFFFLLSRSSHINLLFRAVRIVWLKIAEQKLCVQLKL